MYSISTEKMKKSTSMGHLRQTKGSRAVGGFTEETSLVGGLTLTALNETGNLLRFK